MVSPVVKTIFYRGLLPFSLFAAAIIRPSYLSVLYGFLGLLGPLLPPVRNNSSISGATSSYLFITLLLSTITAVGQIIFQVTQHLAITSDAVYIDRCNNKELFRILFNFGFVWVHPDHWPDSIRIVSPEGIVLVSSFITSAICIFGSTVPSPGSSTENIVELPSTSARSSETQSPSKHHPRSACLPVLKKVSDVCVTLFLAALGMVNPSALNFVYFVIALMLVTWWALYTPLKRRTLNRIKLYLIFYTALHFLLYLAYQVPGSQWFLPSTEWPSKLSGLNPIIEAKCERFWEIGWAEEPLWTYYANFFGLLVFYHILIIQYRWTKGGIRGFSIQDDAESSVHEELLPNDSEANPDGTFPLQRITSEVVDRQKIAFVFKGRAKVPSIWRQSFQQVCYFILYHCYAFALLAMMTFALMYHSVFGLIFLLLPCILWALPNSRQWSFRLSPVIVAYAEFLLIAQYIYSMPLEEFLPQDNYMKIIGFQLAANRTMAFITLATKFLLLLPLFVLLRLHLREHFYDSLSDHERQRQLNYGTFEVRRKQSAQERKASEAEESFIRGDTSAFENISKYLASIWIFVVALVLLYNCLTEPPVLYALGYFVLWSGLICNLVISFRFFRKSIYLLLTTLIVYSSVVIISLYIYQFPEVPDYWKELTGLSDEWNRDIGLVDFKSDKVQASLFTRFFKPLSLLVVTMVQLKFFQSSWTRLVSTPESRSRSPSEDSFGRRGSVESALGHAKSWFHTVYEVLWRLLELHAVRIVLLLVVVLAVNHFCAINFVAICLVVVGVCLPSLTRLICVFICSYLALEFLARQIYQMHFVPKDLLDRTCGPDDFSHQNLSTWIGLNDGDPNNPSADIALMILTIALIGILFAIKYRQKHYRQKYGIATPPPGIVFPEAVDVSNFDRSLVDGFKVAVNYFFYKFGLEMALIASVVDAWHRMDLIATLMLMWVFVFCMSRRSICRVLWPFYLLFCAFLLPYEYAMAVGYPCVEYPWQEWLGKNQTDLNENLLQFLDLASATKDSSKHFVSQIVFDFVVLLFVAAQEFTFRIEAAEHPAGNNYSIYRTGEFILHRDNPHYDFVAEQRSFVDYIKIAIFMYGHWLTMIMVLAAGLGGTSLFALGYLVLAFAMLWQGNNLYIMRNYRKTLSKWYILLAYNVVAMLWKVSLQVIACVWVGEMDKQNLCPVRQLFSIVCVDEEMRERLGNYETGCPVQETETRIGFDTWAFIFLVFQIRIFHSYFFQRCMVDFRCEIIQASRGAILINQLVDKQMREQYQNQVKKFKEIAVRAKEIRRQYEEQFKTAGKNYYVPETYAQAKRAGDFYMFNYDPHSEDVTTPEEQYVPEVLGQPQGKLDPAQLIHTAVSKDMDLQGTLDRVAEAEKIIDEEKRMIEAVREDPEGMKKKIQKLKEQKERIDRAADKPTSSASKEDLRETQEGLELRVRTPSEPSTSESESEEEEKPPKQMVDYLYSALKFLLKILTAILHWLSAFFNRYSREHRYVAYVLDKEKIRLKHTMAEVLYDADQTTQNLRAEWKKRGLQIVASAEDVGRVEEEAQARWEQRHVVTKFVISYVSFITAYTHIVCYIFAVWAHAYCGGLITLPLPLMVFLWGSLCNPRPPKFFWICMILYTELVIIVKFVCQFGFIANPSTTNTNTEWWELHHLLGVQQRNYFSVVDVALLVALFAHRYMLRRIGLWKDANTAETFVDENGSPKRNGSPIPPVFDLDKIKLDLSDSQIENEEEREKEARKEPSSAIGRFFDALLYPRIRYIRDFYPYIFFLDIFCILILTFQYQSFGELSQEQLSLLDSSRVPLMFVVMLFASFTMIIIERALYLRKAVFWKLIYHVFLIAFLHIWVMILLPIITRKKVVENKPAQFFYMVKCLQILVSAWQLRNGYPRLCTGNLLTHSYGMINYGLFYVFMMLPFVFELRTMIDWTWTDTTMPIFDFIKMEMFYAKIYIIKCGRVLEQNFPVPRGIPRGKMIKYMYGIPGIFGVIILMLSPLLAFALLNRIGQHLTPQNMKMHVSLEGFPPLYQMTSQGVDMVELGSARNSLLSHIEALGKNNATERTRRAISFTKDYEGEDIYRIKLRPESDVWWPISQESMDAMVKELEMVVKRNKTLFLNIHLEFTRIRVNKEKEPSIHSNDYQINVKDFAADLVDAIDKANRTADTPKTVKVPAAIPYFLVVPNEGQLREADVINRVVQGECDKNQPDLECLRNQTYLALEMKLIGTNDHKQFLWKIQATNPTLDAFGIPTETTDYGYDGLKYVQIIAFVDRVFPAIFSKFTQGGILAMYIAVVYLGARLLRSVISSEPTDVIIQEMPNPDYLLKICQDIYLVREARDFILEEDLFAKLIFLFRSPATLIKWTRSKVKSD